MWHQPESLRPLGFDSWREDFAEVRGESYKMEDKIINCGDFGPGPIPGKKRKPESEKEGAAVKKKCERSHHVNKLRKNIRRTSRDSSQTPKKCKAKKKRALEDNDEYGKDQKKHRADCAGPDHQKITSYQVLSLLGEGGFSKVMLATLGDKKPPVAIKILKKRSGRISDKILNESKVLQISSESQFLGHGFAAFQTQWHAFLVMEHLSGGSLQDELNCHGSLDMARVCFHSAEVICGLEFLHSRGVVHRDIKPGNIMFDAEGHTKIIDFGLAKMNVFGDNTITGFVGTGGYMAPEIRNLKAYNAAVDWWAFGVTICKMATNMYPFSMESSSDEDSDSENEVVIRSLPINQDLRDLLKKILRKKPHKRLGVRGNIKGHPFFSTINWEELKSQKVPPPFQPRTTPIKDLLKPDKGEEALSFLQSQENDTTSEDREKTAGFSFVSSIWQR